MDTNCTSVEIEIDGAWTEFEFEIAFYAEPFVPANLNGHPDTWCPAEGGDVDVEEVTCTTTGVVFDADDFVFIRNWARVSDGLTATYTLNQLEEECRECAADFDDY